ncbi:MAG: phage tail protein [Terriglobales bacterium]
MAIPVLDSKQYYLDQLNGVVYFSPADGASGTGGTPVQVTHSYTFYSQYLTATELYLLQTGGLAITVSHGGMQKLPDGSESVIFSAGQPGYLPTVVYYPGGAPFTVSNSTSAPTAVGTCTWYRNGAGSGIFQFYSGDAGAQVVITYPYLNPDYDTTAVSAQQNHGPFAVDFLQGTSGQAPPTGLSSKHPDQFASGQLGYTDTAVAYQESGYLGASGTLPDYRYEVIGSNVVGGGTLDADPVLAIQTLLTDDRIGINFPAGSIDTKSWFTAANSASAWVNANKFYVSQAITNPTALSSIIGRWLEAFNIAAVWSEGLVKLIPYGDQSVSSSAPVPATYDPDLTVVASLTDDDYLMVGENQDPVKVSRSSWADAYNRVQVGYRNRVNAYNTDLVFEEDQGSIQRFGLRIEGQQSFEFIATWQLASAIANMRLKRYQTVRNTYAFSLPITYEYLEPMDLVALTDSRLGLSAQVVRIVKITNDPVKGLACEAEDFPGNGYAMPLTNSKASTPAHHPTLGTSAAGETEIVIVQAANAQATSQTPGKIYVWARGKDSSTWGGIDLYRSLDGSNWELMSINVPAAPIYTLTATLPSVASAPSGALNLTHDSTSTLSVQPATSGNIVPVTAGLAAWSPDANYSTGNMVAYDARAWIARASSQGIVPTDSDPHWFALNPVTADAGSPPSVTDAAAANLQNLVAVVGSSSLEFLSYANVAAGPLVNTFALTDLYRGALGTTPQAAAIGSAMVAFDSASATWDIPAGLAGETVYFRYIARNARGMAMQTLEDAATISFLVLPAGSDGAWNGLGGPVGEVISVGGEILTTAVINDANSTTVGGVALSSVTGMRRNPIPDSDIKFPNPYWPLVAGSSIVHNYTANGAPGLNAIEFTETGAIFGTSFSVTAGSVVTLSGFIDATACTAGDTPNWNLFYPQINQYGGGKDQTVGASSRVSATFTTPAGVTTAQVVCGGSIHGTAYFAAPQLELGSSMTAYRSNFLDDLSGGFVSGIPTFDALGNSTTMGSVATGAVTGMQRNQIPDSGQKCGGTYWMLSAGTAVGYSAATGANAATFTATGSNGPGAARFIQGRNTGAGGGNNAGGFSNVVGATYTASCYLDPSNAGGDIAVNIQNTNGGGYKSWTVTKGSAAKRYSFTWTAASGDPSDVIFMVYDLSNSTWANGTKLVIGSPQVEVGSFATAYRESFLDDVTGGFNPEIGLGSGYAETIGSIHDKAHAPVICPVSFTHALPAFGSPLLFAPATGVPSWLEWTVYVNGTAAEVIVDCGSNAGYGFRLDGRSGQPYGTILRSNNYTSLWTAVIAQGPANTAVVSGWHRVQAWLGRAGYMEIYIDGALQCVVTDATYTPTGLLYGQYEVGPASIGASHAAVPDPTQLDPNARALIDGASAHEHWSQSYLPDDETYSRARTSTVVSGVPKPGWNNAWTGLTPDTVDGARFTVPARGTTPTNSGCHTLASCGIASEISFQFELESTMSTSILDVFHADASGNGYLFEIGHSTTDTEPSIWTWNGTTYTRIAVAASTAPAADTLTHQCTIQTFANGQMDVYIDNVLALRATDTTYAPGGSWYLGSANGLPSPYVSNLLVKGHGLLSGVTVTGTATGLDALDNGANYGKTAITQVDSSGNIVVLGTSGIGVRLNLGNGSMTPSTGGRQIKRFYVTQPLGTGYSDQQVFHFTSGAGSPYLLDQSGAALSGFDNPPYVALIPYGMATPPTSFYAGGVTTTQFTMHAVNGGTFTTSPTTLTSGTNSVYSVGTSDTAITVAIVCQATTSVDEGGPLNTPVYQNQNMGFSYSVTSSGGLVTSGTGTIHVIWNSDGNVYTASGSISCSVPAGDTVTVNVTWSNATDATGSAAYTVTYTQSAGATGVNFIAMIGESW